jgi:hypothetical protein
MPAQNLAELLDFESAFEEAAQTVLEASGVNSFISQQNGKLPLINTGVFCDVGSALDELVILPKGNQAVQQQQDYFRYTASLTLQIEVPRDTTKPADQAGVTTFLAQARALVRAAFMMSQWPFDDTNLPLYRVSDIKPMGTITGYNQQRNVDSTTLRFQITFLIQPTAWPTGFPPS